MNKISEIKDRTGLTLSEGNKKLVPIKGVCNFLIFNLPAVSTCPYSTAHCRAACYALKAERVYPTAREARARNYAGSQSDSFVSDMLALIDAYMSKSKYQNIPCYFRVHESGDFYSLEYFNKWLEIWTACKERYDNLYFCFYTKSIAFLPEINYSDFTAQYPNVSANISIWDDSPVAVTEFINNYNFPVYTAATPEKLTELLSIKTNKKCGCASCGMCKMCLVNHKRPLTKICEIH